MIRSKIINSPFVGSGNLGPTYFRLVALDVSYSGFVSDYYMSIQEIEAYESTDLTGVNVLSGKSAFASSSIKPPGNAIDGIASNSYAWTSNYNIPGPQWWGCNMEDSYDIKSIKVAFGGNSQLNRPYTFQLQTGTSPTGPWTDLYVPLNATEGTVEFYDLPNTNGYSEEWNRAPELSWVKFRFPKEAGNYDITYPYNYELWQDRIRLTDPSTYATKTTKDEHLWVGMRVEDRYRQIPHTTDPYYIQHISPMRIDEILIYPDHSGEYMPRYFYIEPSNGDSYRVDTMEGVSGWYGIYYWKNRHPVIITTP